MKTEISEPGIYDVSIHCTQPHCRVGAINVVLDIPNPRDMVRMNTQNYWACPLCRRKATVVFIHKRAALTPEQQLSFAIADRVGRQFRTDPNINPALTTIGGEPWDGT